jgi:hypothetical protein
MAWIIHHLDILEHYCFQYSRHIIIRCSGSIKATKLSKKHMQVFLKNPIRKNRDIKMNKLTFANDYKLGMA